MVESLHLVAYHKCMEQDALLRTVHAVTRWEQLRHLRISWDESHADESTLVAEWIERTGRSRQEATNQVLMDYRPTGARPLASEFCELCMGALGRLTNLSSLSLSGVAMAAHMPLGLYGLSTLERLTSLELLNGRGSNSWSRDAHPNDTDLCCLTSLRRLSISGELLSPAVMTSLAHLSGLTRLSLDLCRPDAAADTLAVGNLCKLQQLRALYITFGSMGSGSRAEATLQLILVLQSVKALAVAAWERYEQELLAQHAPTSQQLSGTSVKAIAPDQRQQAIKAAAGASGGPNGASRRRKQRASDRANRPCPGAGRGCRVTNPASLSQHITTGAIDCIGMEEGEEDDGGAVDCSIARRLSVYLDLAPADAPHCLQLSPGLVDALCDLGPALRRLDAGFATGAASNLYRLTELTSLTSLSLRCLPGTQPGLASWELQRLGTACTQLHTLRLALPPECMDALVPGLAPGSRTGTSGGAALSTAASCVAGGEKVAGGAGRGGGCFQGLRVLELHAYVYVKEVVVRWPDLQPRLAALLTAQLQVEQLGDARLHDGDDNDGSNDAPQPRPQPRSPPLVPQQLQQRAVAAVREPLSTLAQLMHVLPNTYEVQKALTDEADWRDRRLQTRRQALVGQGMTEEEAEAAAQREAAAATPTVPLWVLGQHLMPGQAMAKTLLTGEEADSGDAAWLFRPMSGAAGVSAGEQQAEAETEAELQRARGVLVRACHPVAMHLLWQRQLQALRALLVCEEVVAGPVFRLASWTPRNLQRLRLEGFVGLSYGRCAGGSSGSSGSARSVGSAADWAPPSLREVDVVLHGGPAEEEAALAGLRVWQQTAAAASTSAVSTGGSGPILRVQSRCEPWAEAV
ncbi:hypothetical protein CHLRE_12g510500v5 [Chlamydomonas reinhardtii]|uniref:Uncharacterized protein n=1 Tax=Chlamydomonas reinhardtii TaxID=3055 RepID=A0A2K3D2L4_CHLRE|nr:uncharacterized protein CHLRE_12g510500v5 [Chlamydomonas reinhardtii]PNW74773.1 hypothetical protein CHLRE_12g510500v5 [Chlamydomonas reinhardtii]